MSVQLNGGPLALARRHHEAGELAEAGNLYQQALTANPQQPDVWRALSEARSSPRKLPAALAAYHESS